MSTKTMKKHETVPCPPTTWSRAPIEHVATADRRYTLAFFDGQVQRRVLDEGRHVVGRESTCEVAVSDASVSREHAVFVVERGRVYITDLGSRNGTRVDGKTLRPDEAVEARRGSIVDVGAISLFLTRDPPSSRPPALSLPPRPSREPPTRSLLRLDAREPDILVAPSLEALYATAERIARRDVSVLITGETGVGKEGLAKRIHARSPRASGPFIVLNCAAIPETLIESELFGFVRGAFTGASATKEGLLVAARSGTMFLDEIGELPLAVQAKLLRVLEAKEMTPLGAQHPRPIDVRFVTATHRDLARGAATGTFREDLYHRLNTVRLRVPPLRERPEDILPLAEFFVRRIASEWNLALTPTFTADAREALLAHAWPGNVRELKNNIERAVLLTDDEAVLGVETLDLNTYAIFPERPGSDAHDKPPSRKQGIQREALIAALSESGGNQIAAAKSLGVSRRTLINWMEKLDLPRPRKAPKSAPT